MHIMAKIFNECWISIEDAAKYLDIKIVTLRDWIKKIDENGIPAHKICRQRNFKISELDEWVKSEKSAIR